MRSWLIAGFALLASGCGNPSSVLAPVGPSWVPPQTPVPAGRATVSIDIVSLAVVPGGLTPSGYRYDVDLKLVERTGRVGHVGLIEFSIPGEGRSNCGVSFPVTDVPTPAVGSCLDIYSRAPATVVDVVVHYHDEAKRFDTVTARAVIADP